MAKIMKTNPNDRMSPHSVLPLIPVGELEASRLQPREHFDEAALDRLATRIQTDGQLTPCKVRVIASGRYEILSGERRWRACQRAGLTHVRCEVMTIDDATALRVAIADNLDREDLNAIEQAKAYRRALDAKVYGPKQADLAKALGIATSTLSNLLAILKLPVEWQQLIAQEKFGLSGTHSRPLLQWVHRPQVLAAVQDDLDEDVSYSVEYLAQLLTLAAKKLARPCVPGQQFYQRERGEIMTCELTAKDCMRDDLDLEEIDGMPYAFAVDVWDKIQAQREAADKKADKRAVLKSQIASAKLPPAPVSLFPNDDPDATDTDLRRCLCGLWQIAAAQRLRDRTASMRLSLNARQRRLLTLFAWLMTTDSLLSFNPRRVFAAQAALRTPLKSVAAGHIIQTLTHRSLTDLSQVELLEDWAAALLGELDAEELTPTDWQHATAFLGVTAADGWQCTEHFLRWLSLKQLTTLAKEWRRIIPANKPGAITALLKSGGLRPLPQILANLEGTS